MPRLASLLPLLAAGALGCAELSDVQLGAIQQAVIDCDEWVCGSNSPVIATYYFHELNINGLPNAEGFQVMSLWKAGIHYHLHVEEGRIIGRAGSLQIQGAQLQDAQIRIRRGFEVYAVRISGIGSVATFAKLGGAPRPLETYLLDVAELSGDAPRTDWKNLCSNPPGRYNPDVQGMNAFHSLVFEGERIDKDQKTISSIIDPSWFNIGCAGHALAKMAINAQTDAARRAFGFNTTIADRQTFLKMVTGDYCGTGVVFTVSGQPLQWADWRDYTNYVSSPLNLELEARWNPNGATCLNTPRVFANPTALGMSTFGNNFFGFMNAIKAECGNVLPPSCAGGVDFFGSQLWLSANPL